MNGYTKLFGSILASTIWSESKETKIIWITMLALVDRDGNVNASVPGLATLARLSVPETEDALSVLQRPDKYSRTKDHEGRRIEPIDGGWKILNHEKYRKKMNADERREYLRIKKRESRKRLKVNNESTDVPNCHQSQHIHIADTDTNTPLTPQGGKEGFCETSEEFQKAWAEWKAYKGHQRPQTEKAQLAHLATLGEAGAIAAIRNSIINGWSGLKYGNGKPNSTSPPTKSTKQITEDMLERRRKAQEEREALAKDRQ